MNEAGWLFLGTALTVLAGAAATVWIARRSSPDSQAKLGGAYDRLVASFEIRLAALERKVDEMERDLDAYHRLYGPLPLPQQPSTPTETS